MKNNKYIEFYDKKTGSLVLSGKVLNQTDNPIGISVDGILFINPNNFVVKEVYFADFFQDTNIKNKYRVFLNNNIDNTFEYDFFMWNEIEPEVKPTVDLLNSLGFIETYSSCSGHGKIPPYIDFKILDYTIFFDFIEFLNNNGIKSYCSKHAELDEDEYKIRFIIGVESKGTCHLELLEPNQSFDKINRCIQKYKVVTGR